MGMRAFGIGASAVDSWSHSEQSVSRDRNVAEGAVSQMQLAGTGTYNPLGDRGKELRIVTDEYGVAKGTVTAASKTPGGWSLEANSPEHIFSGEASVRPQSNERWDQVVRDYLTALGLPTNSVSVYVHPSLTSQRVHVPATTGNVWRAFKQLMSANGVTACWRGDQLCIVPLGYAPLAEMRDVIHDWTISSENHEEAPRISCYVYHRESVSVGSHHSREGLIYPPRKTFYPLSSKHMIDGDGEIPVLTVDARERTTHVLPLATEVRYVNQPYCVSSINVLTDPLRQHGSGIYTVVGSDNRPIRADQWRDYGGLLSVRLLEDSRSVEVTLVGADIPWLAPFRIAESDGKRDYPSLFLSGTGFRVDIEEIYLNTASPKSKGKPIVIDNPAIDTVDKAYEAMHYLAEAYSGSKTTMTVKGTDPLRRRETLSTTTWGRAGLNRQTLNALAGQRFVGYDRMWLCTEATISDQGVDMALETDDRLSDLDNRWGLPRVAQPKMRGRTLASISGDRPVA